MTPHWHAVVTIQGEDHKSCRFPTKSAAQSRAYSFTPASNPRVERCEAVRDQNRTGDHCVAERNPN